ncbi:hypothetical protein GDO81_012498 [Engystomops pustulosus]|uniref:Uncharacterized protein n=1 Tax=Engystomops pustulosus TaxID=76066 RepID=A0AAV7BM18_ENGPU|nr:hypothetical protein GDO81_012498 [Engystomops pustulosus]
MAEPAVSPRKEKFFYLSRFAPSPSLAELQMREKRFVLDCVAVQNISKDYSVSLPKLGSVIPPYNAQQDHHVHNYFHSRPVPPLLRRTGQSHGGTSTLGDLADRFQHNSAAATYLQSRNRAGSGHSAEHARGHALFLSSIKPVIGYNGLYGYRRNTPSLRRMPSPFGIVTKSAIY